jgi:hypothetical protein
MRTGAAVLVSVLALGGAAAWRATRGGDRPVPTGTATPAAAKIREGAPSALTPDRAAKREYVAELVHQGSEEATQKLVASYVSWSGTPELLAERQDILEALYKIEAVPRRLKAVLDAIAGDTTPSKDDPLFSRAVDLMARTWGADPARLAQMQDLMLMETRPKAGQLLATSLAEYGQTEPAKNLPAERRTAIVQDLVDVYFKPGNEEGRPEIQAAVGALAGDDVAKVLKEGAVAATVAGLDTVRENEKAVSEALKNLAAGKPIVPIKIPPTAGN